MHIHRRSPSGSEAVSRGGGKKYGRQESTKGGDGLTNKGGVQPAHCGDGVDMENDNPEKTGAGGQQPGKNGTASEKGSQAAAGRE